MAKQKSPSSLGSLMGQAADTLPASNPKDAPRATERGYEMPAAERPRQKVGRKPSYRTIQRRSGMSIFFEDAHRAALSRIGEFDKQDVIRTALNEFLLRHCQTGYLDDAGRSLIQEYIDRTTDFETQHNVERIMRNPTQAGW